MRKNRRTTFRAFFYTLYLFGCSAFFITLFQYLFELKIEPLAALCLPFLVVLFGFSSLFYNRGRALPAGPDQRRSLYIAELTMQSAIFYLLGIGITAIIFYFLWIFQVDNASISKSARNGISLIFFFPAAFLLFSFFSFFFSVRLIAHKTIKHYKPIKILRSLK